MELTDDIIDGLQLTEVEEHVLAAMTGPSAIPAGELAELLNISPGYLAVVRTNLRKRLRMVGIEVPDGRTQRGTILRRRERSAQPLMG
ncbi:MAG: hypothetical protein AAF916_07010 [Planctomycetota bacterium]